MSHYAPSANEGREKSAREKKGEKKIKEQIDDG